MAPEIKGRIFAVYGLGLVLRFLGTLKDKYHLQVDRDLLNFSIQRSDNPEVWGRGFSSEYVKHK